MRLSMHILRRIRRSSSASIGFMAVLAYVLLALLSSLIVPYDPLAISDKLLAAPSAAHWMGTDQLGRDILSRVIHGAGISLQVALPAVGLALGLPSWRVMLIHVLPGAAPALIVQTTLSLAFAVLAEATLSFLGLSGQTDAPSWGLMLRQGKDLMELAWWVAVFPGAAVSLAVLSLNVLGDGLRDALDPRLAG